MLLELRFPLESASTELRVCGIAGIVNFDGEPVAGEHLAAMAEAMAHRGPDGEGIVQDGEIGLAHRRLAVLDLSDAGSQPMTTPAGDFVLTYNGEVYNFKELRRELEGLGYRFRSHTDTEVVLHAWREWGEQCLDRLNGMFAFAVWDCRKHVLFLARDRYGIKPLYYFNNGNVLLFASEIKALLRHPAVRVKVCAEALSEYFTFQNIFTDRTLFDGVRLLPAGSFMRIPVRDGGDLGREQFWDFKFEPDGFEYGEEEAAEELCRLFEQAVTRQLVSDVPVGTYLSGGIDSSSITAVASRHIPRIRTFTGGFDLSSASGLELAFDERAASEIMANQLKTEHYEMVMHAGDMEYVLPQLIWHLEDLRVGQCYPNYYIAQLAGKFVKVVLSGSGGDELFAGYPWRYYRGIGNNHVDKYLSNYYNYWQRLVPDDDHAELFTEGTRRAIGDHQPRDVFGGVFRGIGDRSFRDIEDVVNASLYFENKTFLHGLLLVEDKISMAHSLESRVPFLDNDLVDFALRIPPRFKLRDIGRAPTVDEDEPGKTARYQAQPTADGKIVFRRAMSGLIAESTVKRAKQGFSAPDASWFRGESINYVDRLLRDPKARICEYLNSSYVEKVLDEHMSGRANRRLLIWSLLSFEWWLRKFTG